MASELTSPEEYFKMVGGSHGQPSKKKRASPEADAQAAIFKWSEGLYWLYPEFEFGLFAIPNGQYRKGQRMEPGLKGGVPDIQLAVARGGYHGFFGELKIGRNKPSDEQKAYIEYLNQQGYYVAVAWGEEAMEKEILDYMELDKESE